MNRTSAGTYRRDRWLIIVSMVVLCLLSWSYLFHAAKLGHHQTMAMPDATAWDGGLLAVSTLMWSIMMIAMMLPTATPMVLSFTRLQHRRWPRAHAARLIWSFIAGYLVAWSLFSLAAASGQWTLHGLGLMTAAMGRAAPFIAGAFLIGAGLFQWSSVKDACLSKCRSPLDFLLNEWRPGTRGALTMGLRHGLFCVGCCWMLMLLMLVGGVMNVFWMAAITLYVLAEKLLPRMREWGRLTGTLLMLTGILMLTRSLPGTWST